MSKMNMFRAAVFAGALAVPMAATTSAQPNVVVGGGLVNVQITEVIDDITISDNVVAVSVNAAVQLLAQLCNINVLAADVVGEGCEITNGDQVTRFIQVIE